MSPLVKNRKGHYKELFEQLRKKGYLNIRVDGDIQEITPGLKLDRYKNHDIELVIDRLKVSVKDRSRINDTVENALHQGNKQMMVYDVESGETYHYSQLLMD